MDAYRVTVLSDSEYYLTIESAKKGLVKMAKRNGILNPKPYKSKVGELAEYCLWEKGRLIGTVKNIIVNEPEEKSEHNESIITITYSLDCIYANDGSKDIVTSGVVEVPSLVKCIASKFKALFPREYSSGVLANLFGRGDVDCGVFTAKTYNSKNEVFAEVKKVFRGEELRLSDHDIRNKVSALVSKAIEIVRQDV